MPILRPAFAKYAGGFISVMCICVHKRLKPMTADGLMLDAFLFETTAICVVNACFPASQITRF